MENDAPAPLTPEYLRLATLCESIYRDEFMRSSEAFVENNVTDTQYIITSDLKENQLVVCFGDRTLPPTGG